MGEYDEGWDGMSNDPATNYSEEVLATTRALFLGADDTEGGEPS